MYSVKPGRGPSLIVTIVASAFAAIGVIQLIGGNLFLSFMHNMSRSMGEGASGFSPFISNFRLMWNAISVVFILTAAAIAVYSYLNFRKRNRMSALDITTGSEEPDPISTTFGYEPGGQPSDGTATDEKESPRRFEGRFCPFCGAEVEGDFDFCPKCGKDI